MATVVGDAGVGKTRLIRELVAAWGTSRVIVRGRCLPYGDGITFWPVAEAVLDAASIGTRRFRRRRPREARGADGRPRGDACAWPRCSDSSTEPYGIDEIFWGVRRCSSLGGGSRPVVWVIDDIHWAEPTLLDLIGTCWRRPGRAIVLLCSSRHDLLDRSRLGRPANARQRVMLEPLTDADAAKWSPTLSATPRSPIGRDASVAAAAEGNPLFVEQLISMLVDDGHSSASGTVAWRAAGPRRARGAADDPGTPCGPTRPAGARRAGGHRARVGGRLRVRHGRRYGPGAGGNGRAGPGTPPGDRAQAAHPHARSARSTRKAIASTTF